MNPRPRHNAADRTRRRRPLIAVDHPRTAVVMVLLLLAVIAAAVHVMTTAPAVGGALTWAVVLLALAVFVAEARL